MYDEIYDIDWFFLDRNNYVGHIASGGGVIPPSVKKDSDYSLRKYFDSVPNIDNSLQITENTKKILGIYDENELEKILSDFIFLSKKGICCFDKTFLNEPRDPKYHKVIQLKNKLNLHSLPFEIREKLIKTKLDISIEDSDRIDIEKVLF